MSNIENPPAFPCEAQGNRDVPPEHDYIQTGIYTAKFPGMTLRDWFAGQALASAWALAMEFSRSPESPETFAARTSYAIADAMLAERVKREQP